MMNGDGNYYAENVFPRVTMVRWCAGCSAEQATKEIDVQINGQWLTIDIGPECLTRAQKESKIEL